MFVFNSSVSEDSAAYRATRTVTDPSFEVKELGVINMVSMAHLADTFREPLG